jgi:hypothetical protein
MQTVNLKVTSVNDRHVFATLFMNGASLGHLIFDHREYQIFSTMLLMGAEQTNKHIKDISDYSVFEKWVEEQS